MRGEHASVWLFATSPSLSDNVLNVLIYTVLFLFLSVALRYKKWLLKKMYYCYYCYTKQQRRKTTNRVTFSNGTWHPTSSTDIVCKTVMAVICLPSALQTPAAVENVQGHSFPMFPMQKLQHCTVKRYHTQPLQSKLSVLAVSGSFSSQAAMVKWDVAPSNRRLVYDIKMSKLLIATYLAENVIECNWPLRAAPFTFLQCYSLLFAVPEAEQRFLG